MTDLTTAARLALDTLTDPRIGQWSYMEGYEIYGDFNTAADALRAALAAPAVPQERVEPDQTQVICPKCCHQFRAIPTQVQSLLLGAGFEPPFLGHQISEPRREPVEYPVGWRVEDDSENAARTFILVQDREDAFNMAPAGTTPQPLYTRPSPAREPLTLTDEQIMDIGGCGPNNGSLSWLLCFARAVLAAAGETN
jgi:hypothetical protein